MKAFADQHKAKPVLRRHTPAVAVDQADRTRCLQRRLIRQILDSPRPQFKLTIGAPNDVYEQEADRVADEVMRMPEPRVQRPCSECEDALAAGNLRREIDRDLDDDEELARKPLDLVQRRADDSLEDDDEAIQTKPSGPAVPQVTSALESNIRSMKTGGQPLSASERAFFEPRFGHDFSKVQIHNDVQAAETARAVSARAFTVGWHVVFGAGQYQPETRGGKRLLAHELTHVVQQRGQTKLGELRLQRESEGKKKQQESICPAPKAVTLSEMRRLDPTLDPRALGATFTPKGYTIPKFTFNATEEKEGGKSVWRARPKRVAKASGGKSEGVYYASEGRHELKKEVFAVRGGKIVEIPQYLDISAAWSALVRAGEQEHCNDFERAYEISLKEVEDVLETHVFGTNFTGPTKAAAEQLVLKIINIYLRHPELGNDQAQWGNKYRLLLHQGVFLRDTQGRHTVDFKLDTTKSSREIHIYKPVKGPRFAVNKLSSKKAIFWTTLKD